MVQSRQARRPRGSGCLLSGNGSELREICQHDMADITCKIREFLDVVDSSRISEHDRLVYIDRFLEWLEPLLVTDLYCSEIKSHFRPDDQKALARSPEDLADSQTLIQLLKRTNRQCLRVVCFKEMIFQQQSAISKSAPEACSLALGNAGYSTVRHNSEP